MAECPSLACASVEQSTHGDSIQAGIPSVRAARCPPQPAAAVAKSAKPAGELPFECLAMPAPMHELHKDFQALETIENSPFSCSSHCRSMLQSRAVRMGHAAV